MNVIQTIGIEGLPIIKAGDNLAKLICMAAKRQGTSIQSGDVVVVTHVVVSRAEGRVINLNGVVPSEFAKNIAEGHKDPAFVEAVLRESRSIIRMIDGKLITETKHGLVVQTLVLIGLTFQERKTWFCCLITRMFLLGRLERR